MGLAMESHESEEVSFALFLGKTNDNVFKKCKIPYFGGTFCINLGKREFSTKIRPCHFLASTVPELYAKKLKKTNEPILRKTFN